MIFFDLTTLAFWFGPPVGIVRVQQQLARFMRDRRPDIVPTVFDPEEKRWRRIRPEWLDALIEGDARIDPSLLPEPTGRKRRAYYGFPPALRAAFFWLTRPRPKALAALEQARLFGGSERIRAIAGRVQEAIMSEKYRQRHFARNGRRVAVPSLSRIAGEPIDPGPGDTIFTAQIDWIHTDIRAIRRAREERGFRYFLFCYDLFPVRVAGVCPEGEIATFKRHFDVALAVADKVFLCSRYVERDVNAYAAELGIRLKETVVVQLGSDFRARAGDGALPAGLAPGQYVLYVGSIEPRKNQQRLIAAWRQLVADGTVGQSGYRLVLVGRQGWNREYFEAVRDAGVESVMLLQGIHDDLLNVLYRSAGFCVFPSLCEGYGLPVGEALAHGKPLIAARAWAIPEVVGDNGLLLDPLDVDAWADAMRRWIENSGEREAYAALAREHYRPVSWDVAATAIFNAVGPAPGSHEPDRAA